MNMFTKLLETLGNNFWLIIILCLEAVLAVWLLCFARGKKKNRAAEQCDELRFFCKRICVRDVLNLFNVQTAPFAPVRTVIYPRRMKVQLLLSQASAGTPQPEGKMQNRKGNDPSEMFDLREYARLVLLTGQLHPRVRAAGKGGLRRHRARGV